MSIVFLGASQSLSIFKRVCDLRKIDIVGVVDSDYYGNTDAIEDVKVIGSEETFNFDHNHLYFVSSSVIPINTRDRQKRLKMIDLIKRLDLPCATLIHPESEVYGTAKLSPGCYVGFMGAVTNNAVMEPHSQLHAYASLPHDCVLGENSVLERYSAVVGRTKIGKNVHFGIGSMSIKSLTTVGDNAVIHPRVTVARDVDENEIVSLAGNNTKRIYGTVIRS